MPTEMNNQAAQTMPERRTFTDAEIREWMERHDLESMSLTDARAAVEDAQSMDMLAAAPAASGGDGEMCPNCVTPWKCNGPHESTGGASVSGGEDGPIFHLRSHGDVTAEELKTLTAPTPTSAASVSERARELLAREYEREGLVGIAVCLRKGSAPDGTAMEPIAVRALEQALTQQRGSEDAWPLAIRVREALDRESCPDHFMRVAVETITGTTPQPSADAVRELVKRWRDKSQLPLLPEAAYAQALVCARELESLLSAASDHQQNAAQGGGEK